MTLLIDVGLRWGHTHNSMDKSTYLTGALALALVIPAVVASNPADISVEPQANGSLKFIAGITDPDGPGKVANMRLVVYVAPSSTGFTEEQLEFTGNIPIDGTTVEITVGPFLEPFGEQIEVLWRVFGGGERDYDNPSWNGYGEPGFGASVTAYATEVGTFNWVLAGPNDPNPFTNWNVEIVDPHTITGLTGAQATQLCKDGQWKGYGFKNQGQCVRYLVTGQDSR